MFGSNEEAVIMIASVKLPTKLLLVARASLRPSFEFDVSDWLIHLS